MNTDIIAAANAVSVALHHYHALDTTEGLTTTRQLQDAWIAAGTERAAWLDDADERTRSLYQGALGPGITGWGERASDIPDWPILRHSTGTGRLDIMAGRNESGPYLTVKVEAGPTVPGGPGRSILRVLIREDATHVMWFRDGKSLVAEKPHRLAELVRYVDRPLGGIVSAADPVVAGYAALPTERAEYVTGPQAREGLQPGDPDWEAHLAGWHAANEANAAAERAAGERYETALAGWVADISATLPVPA